jgi:hypothetical protein
MPSESQTPPWATCPKGSCHRHQACMYAPCRRVTTATGGAAGNLVINHALKDAIRRAYAIGRVDQAIGVAATELLRMVEADPGITPEEALRRHSVPASRWSNIPDWDRALWALADVWCELHRGLQGHPERQLPASPYAVLSHIRAAYEAGREAGERAVMESVLSVLDAEPAREAATTPR